MLRRGPKRTLLDRTAKLPRPAPEKGDALQLIGWIHVTLQAFEALLPASKLNVGHRDTPRLN